MSGAVASASMKGSSVLPGLPNTCRTPSVRSTSSNASRPDLAFMAFILPWVVGVARQRSGVTRPAGVHGRVMPAERQEFGVRAELDDAPALDHGGAGGW